MSFSKDQVYCVLDYETYSECGLKKCGAFEYSVHPSTEILCVAWRIGTKEKLKTAPVHWWYPQLEAFPRIKSVFQYESHSLIFVAHNAFFEEVITRRFIADIPPERWLCTASLAASLALPRSLEGACLALGLTHQKDMGGKRLMMRMCVPRKPTKNNPAIRINDAESIERLAEYCVKDVEAETELFLKLPPLTKTERRVWCLDQKINMRGFLVDRSLIKTVQKMMKAETERLTNETRRISGGKIKSTKQVAATIAWLEEQGVDLPDLRKKTVYDAIPTVCGVAREMLEIRQAASKSSTAKYTALEERSRHDGRIRDGLLYHAASTGRWGGRGVQPQNFPRPSIKDTETACDVLMTGDLEYVRLLYGSPMDAFSSCLRGTIIAPEGKILDVADYAGIEARVLFWVAKHDMGLKAFAEGRDIYKELARYIFNLKNLEDVTDKQRFVGKTAILGCGYSMGWKKFMQSCENLGQIVSEETAQMAVRGYREAHSPVVRTWDNIHRASIAAVEHPGKRYIVNRTKWWLADSFLWCELPSERRLAYYKPTVKYEKTPWGDTKPTLYHYGVGMGHKWELQKTYGGKLTENVVQAISRDVMAEALLEIEQAGWEIDITCHDEIIAERDISNQFQTNEHFKILMASLSPWAEGLPLKVEGFSTCRYRK